MREIASPLDGIRSPFGQLTSPLAIYSVLGFKPKLVLDFDDERYFDPMATSTSFSDLITHSASTNATMVDSDGLLKWRPHNLALNSATPATQSITVVSGADYTVECTGVSIALSGAGTGTVTEGNPVTITASTTTLTLTVTGSNGTMWAYRSDLGGMVNNPDRGDSYVPTTSSAVYLPRRGHHVYNGSAWVNEGLLHESEARTNLLHTTDVLVTQSLTVTAVPHTLHFTGTGTVTLSGASTAGPLVGTGAGEQNRVSLTFTPTATLLLLTVSGTVTNAQLEVGSVPSSYIPNLAASGSVTRNAETLTVPAAKLPYSATAMSIQMEGRVTYADEGAYSTAVGVRWQEDSQNKIIVFDFSTNSTDVGRVFISQENNNVYDAVSEASPGSYSPDILVPFNIASRHGSTFINGAVDGTAMTADITPTGLPDLSATDLNLGFDYMGCIKLLRIWSADLGDAGIAQASTS